MFGIMTTAAPVKKNRAAVVEGERRSDRHPWEKREIPGGDRRICAFCRRFHGIRDRPRDALSDGRCGEFHLPEHVGGLFLPERVAAPR